MSRLSIVAIFGALVASIGGAAEAQTLRPFSLDIGAAADIDSNSYRGRRQTRDRRCWLD